MLFLRSILEFAISTVSSGSYRSQFEMVLCESLMYIVVVQIPAFEHASDLSLMMIYMFMIHYFHFSLRDINNIY